MSKLLIFVVGLILAVTTYSDNIPFNLSKISTGTKKNSQQLKINQAPSKGNLNLDQNFGHGNIKLISNTSVIGMKKSYWRMLLRFIISDFVVIFIFSLFLILTLLPLAPIGLLAEKINKGLSTVISIPFIIISGLGQAYFWILWASYCAFTIQFYLDSPTASFSLLYYLTGFFVLTVPISWLSRKEPQSATSYEERKQIQGGASFYSLISIVAFIVFCIWKNLLDYEYISWINNWLY